MAYHTEPSVYNWQTTPRLRLRKSLCWVRSDRWMIQCKEFCYYNRAVWLPKLVNEALMRQAWNGFISWINSNHTDDNVHMKETQRCFLDLRGNVCSGSFSLNNILLNIYHQTYITFYRQDLLESHWLIKISPKPATSRLRGNSAMQPGWNTVLLNLCI